jgi:hypothetical protein
MSTTKQKPTPTSTATAGASSEPTTYRINPEVEAKIDSYIKENPKTWNYLQAMPRDRLERTVVLNEVRQVERQQRMRDGLMKKINADPELKQAYDILVKNVPEDQREEVMTQMQRQKQRVLARSEAEQQTQGKTKSQSVGV